MGKNHIKGYIVVSHFFLSFVKLYSFKVKGFEIVERINSLAKPPGSGDEQPTLSVQIVNCGQLDCSNGECKVLEISQQKTS